MIEQPVVTIGMSDLHVLQTSGVLRTCGLGSCVGLSLYDRSAKVAGMAHIMLPTSSIAHESEMKLAKYADTAISELILRMISSGASIDRIEAKLAGGAQMFVFKESNDSMRIGPRNIESCKAILQMNSIPVVAEDTGGNYGRTIELHCDNGKMQVRSVNHSLKEL